jgi:hypothetical protein
VYKAAIRTHRQDFNTQGFVFIVSGSNRCQLSRSDKGKVPGIETEYNPFPFIFREFDGLKSFAGNEGA